MPKTASLKTSECLDVLSTLSDSESKKCSELGSMQLIDDRSLDFLRDVVSGLEGEPKALPCKYFYDDEGSQLFEEICATKEYYITRTELALLPEVAKSLYSYFDRGLTIVEPGCGAGEKVKILINELNEVQSFVPLDISASALSDSVSSIERDFPYIEIKPLLGDFTKPEHLFELSCRISGTNDRLVFFPGSTIGNFEYDAAVSVLKNLSVIAGVDGYLLVGVDLIKDRRKLLNAYNDENGVTEAFNKNILLRANKELNADFNVESGFDHLAIFNENYDRIEMHLRSRCDQTVSVDGMRFSFGKNECVHTENSHKYSIKSFTQLADAANLDLIECWTDKDSYFGVFLLKSCSQKKDF